MICPCCGKQIPDGNLYCIKCGCNLSAGYCYHTDETALAVVAENVAERKNYKGAAIIFAVLFAVTLVAGLILAFSFAGLSEDIAEKNREISLLEDEVSAKKEKEGLLSTDVERLRNIIAENLGLIYAIGTEENLGYASESFHANRGVVVMKTTTRVETLDIYMDEENARMWFGSTDPNVVRAKWTDGAWQGEKAQVYLYPLETGFSILEFTNSVNDESFRVFVIVIE